MRRFIKHVKRIFLILFKYIILDIIRENEIIFRKDEIVKKSQNKNVLDLGFVQHSHWKSKVNENVWLHSKIKKKASNLVGIDYLKSEIDELRTKGYDCYAGDVMNLDRLNLKRKFDLIICGELLEHVENPGLMLEGIKRFMKEDARLIITTPNVMGFKLLHYMNENVVERSWLNFEHVAYYSYETLKNLIERSGFKKVKYDFYFGDSLEIDKKIKNYRLVYRINRLILNTLLKDKLKKIFNFLKQISINYQKYHFHGLFFIIEKK